MNLTTHSSLALDYFIKTQIKYWFKLLCLYNISARLALLSSRTTKQGFNVGEYSIEAPLWCWDGGSDIFNSIQPLLMLLSLATSTLVGHEAAMNNLTSVLA